MASDPVTVLIVDDAPDVRMLVGTRLKLSGRFEIVGEAGNGAEAIEQAALLRPDIVLLDVSMPVMDGLDALPRILEQAPGTKVVMFSGFDERGLADRARALGAFEFVEKSASIDRLTDVLFHALSDDAPPPTTTGSASDPEPVLLEHLERFGAAFDEAAIGMASLTLTGRIVRANAQFERLVGRMVAGPLVGTSFEDMASGPGRAALATVLRQVGSGTRDADSAEHDLGDRKVVSTAAVVRDSRGVPLYLFLQAQDVTERQAVAELLRQSEERFRLLVESVGDYAIFMLDPGGHIASWNLGAQRTKGYTADEILGRHFSVFYLEDAVAAQHPQRELEIATAEGRYEEEGWRVRKDGSTFWANVVITALRGGDGKLLGFAKVTRDMTERKRLLDSLEAAAAQRAEFLAVTAHELRSPVSRRRVRDVTRPALGRPLRDGAARDGPRAVALRTSPDPAGGRSLHGRPSGVGRDGGPVEAVPARRPRGRDGT